MLLPALLAALDSPALGRTPQGLSLHRIPLVVVRPGAKSRPENVTTTPAETLVVDPRGNLTPSQVVEGRLASLLGHGPDRTRFTGGGARTTFAPVAEAEESQ